MRLATSKACWELWLCVAGGAAWEGEAGRGWRTHEAKQTAFLLGRSLTLLSPAAGPECILDRLARARQAPDFGGTGYSAGPIMGPGNSVNYPSLGPGSGSARQQPA